MHHDADAAARQIAAFLHIPKTAGMTMTGIMRSTFGLRYCRTGTVRGVGTGDAEREFAFVLRLYPGLRAVGGHNMRPNRDYGIYDERLRWFTVLRDPIARFRSHYQYDCKMRGVSPYFADWCAENGDRLANRQVVHLAGEQDVDRAREQLLRMAAVGDQAAFDTTLRLFACHIGDPRFPTSTARVINTSPAVATEHDNELAAKYNRLDMELYDWFRAELWPEQLRTLPDIPARPDAVTLGPEIRRVTSLAYHGLVYKNAVRVRHRLRSRCLDGSYGGSG